MTPSIVQRALLSSTLLALLAAPAAAGQVLRLGAGTQTLHATPQDAIDVATDGDVLLFESGTYPGFTVPGLALTLAALPDANVRIEGSVQVRWIDDSKRVVLSGLTIIGPADVSSPIATYALWIRSAGGEVVLQDCTVEGNSCGSSYRGGDALRVTDSPRVAVLGCNMLGGDGGNCGIYLAFGGGQGLVANASRVVIQDSVVLGGSGENADGIGTHAGGDGATAVRLVGAELYAAGTSIYGGAGGDAHGFLDPAGSGGDGIYVDAASTAHLLDVLVQGGAMGYGVPGSSGQPIAGPGTVVQHAGTARSLAAPRWAGEADPLGLAIEGDPGDRIWAVTSLTPGWLPWPSLAGVWLVPFPTEMRVTPLVVLPAGGSASSAFPPQPVSSPVGATSQTLQLYVLGGSSGAWLGGARSILRLDRDALPDCDGNGVFDLLEILQGAGDCDGDWQLDTCQIASGQLADCNANGVPDTCDLAAGTSVDVNGNGIPDECEPMTVWHVDASAPPGGDGSAASPFQALAPAFSAAISGDEITVAPGTYVGAANRALSFAGRTLHVHAPGGPDVTEIDAQGLARIFRLTGGEGAGTRIQGFTLRNGRGSTGYPMPGGGGINAYLASFEVVDCVFEGCASAPSGGFAHGGGLNADECTVLVDRCTFRANTAAAGFGAGISLIDCRDSVVRDSRFIRNRSSRRGGGLHSWDSSLVVAGCTFYDNEADLATYGEGGGAAYILNFDYATTLMGCLFAGNDTVESGGALNLSTHGTPIVVADCTFTANTAAVSGGALAAFNVELVNSVLWGDSAGNGDELNAYSGPSNTATLWVDYSLVAGGQAGVSFTNNGVLQWGSGNQSGDPLFVDPDGPDNDPSSLGDNDYRLQGTSPALDAGDNTSVPADLADVDRDGNTGERLPIDLDGLPRFRDIPGAPDVGFGTPPLVDLGCYERQP